MEYVTIGLCIIVIIAIAVILYRYKKKKAITGSFAPSAVIIPAPTSEEERIVPTQEDALQEISIPVY